LKNEYAKIFDAKTVLRGEVMTLQSHFKQQRRRIDVHQRIIWLQDHYIWSLINIVVGRCIHILAKIKVAVSVKNATGPGGTYLMVKQWTWRTRLIDRRLPLHRILE